MMVRAFARLLLAVVLTGAAASQSPAGTEEASPCPSGWLLFGKRCFAFYPVWSSWTSANSMCLQAGGNLVSLHTPEEQQFVQQLANNTHTPVWLGGRQAQQNDTWFWSDDSPFRISDWTNQRPGNATEGGACMAMTPKNGELHSAPCGELRFYICSTRASATVFPNSRKPVEQGIVPTESLFDVMWSYSDSLADEILRSSFFLEGLQSGRLTQRCYASFLQQEALYLHGVSGTLEALIGRLQGTDNVSLLLLDTLKHYSSKNQSLPTSPPPPWLCSSLLSFHSVVLEDPVYWLVALSARASLRHLLARELIPTRIRPCAPLGSGSQIKDCSYHQQWSEDTQTEVAWTFRYKKVIEERQQHVDVFQAVNVFREHMINRRSFYKALDTCDEEV